MMTKIQWTEATWNPIVGCSLVSPGCTNCYAMRLARRLSLNPSTPQYHGTVTMVKRRPVWSGRINRAGADTLRAPLHRRKPTLWFVNSMGDLFHEDVPDAWIDQVFAIMALCPQHQFQVLTKRAARMREYMTEVRAKFASETLGSFEMVRGEMLEGWPEMTRSRSHPHGSIGMPWPLPNVWLGVSAEDQRRWNERREALRDTPAAVRFVSAEPLLAPIDFGADLDWLDWAIVGGESGPGARPCNVGWIGDITDQCQAAGVPVFVKQLGAKPINHFGVDIHLTDRKGGAIVEWPAELQIRELPR